VGVLKYFSGLDFLWERTIMCYILRKIST